MTTSEPFERRVLPLLYVIGGCVGLAAALTLLVEKIELLKDPSYVPSCSINPILSCGSVMITPQAEVFGFPNPIVGVVGFSVLVTIGVLLITKVALPGWMWAALQLGTSFGVLFIHWLIFQSLYRIDALCPYCMVVWVVTIPIFWYTTLRNLGALERSPGPLGTIAAAVRQFHGAILTAWLLAIVVLILIRFWDYWSSLAP